MSGALTHRGVRYAEVDELARRLAPTLGDAVDAGDAVAVAVDGPTRAQLTGLLGARAEAVEFVDATRPSHIDAFQLAARRAALVQQRAREGRRSVFVGQNQPTLGLGDAYWVRLEAALQYALAELPATLLCPYRDDAAALVRVHPEIDPGDGAAAPNPAVCAPAEALDGFTSPPLPDLGDPVLTVEVDHDALGVVRRRLGALLDEAGIAEGLAGDLVYAVSEIATNTVEHGAGHGTVSVWAPGTAVICEVADAGSLGVPFPGVRPPPREQERGRGLWLARTLCDALDVRVDADGTRVRLAIAAPA